MPAHIESSPRVVTGISGLDDILDGGLPPDGVYLIQGDPGTGKTTTALQFLIEGVRRGERVLFLTLSETKVELETVAHSHGLTLEGMQVFELSAAQQNRPAEQNTLFHPSEVELNELTQVLLEEVERVKPARVVLDSLLELRLLSQSPLRFRRQILALKQHFIGKKCTVLLLDDRISRGSLEEAPAHTAAHGVIELEQAAPVYGAERRRVRVVKLRGVRFRGGWHDYTIVRGGLRVFPRLIAAEHRQDFESTPVSSGIAELDSLLGGGVDRGTSMLLLGAAGTGKSSIAMQYVRSALGRGDRAAMFLFDENLHTMLMRGESMGISLRDAMNEERLSVRQIDPAEMPPGEFVSLIRSAVEANDARVVVIDSINGYMNAMTEERFLAVQMHELLSYLNQRGVLTIVIVAQHGLIGPMESPVDVSYLSDVVVLLRYFEVSGEVHQAISVVKKGTGRHERTIREFQITPAGIRVGMPVVDFQGVLSGVPIYTGRSGPLMEEKRGS